MLMSPPCRRIEEVPSDHEAETLKSAKRRRVSDNVEHEPVAGDKTSKKAKKLKAENGAAVPVSADTNADAQKKGKKDKKAKKGVESKEGDFKKEEGKGDDAKQKQGDKSAMRELPNGLKIQDAKIGDGPQVKSGMKVNMRYVGKLLDGKIFDSNTKGKPVRRPR
jgi:FK506-binding nuclear protein